MDKKFIKNIMTVVLGVALIALISSMVSFITDVATLDEVIRVNSYETTTKNLVKYVKWCEVGTLIFMVTLFASYFFAYFSTNKTLKAAAAALSFALAVLAVTLICCDENMGQYNSEALVVKLAFIKQMLGAAVPALLIGVYFTIEAKIAFDKKSQTDNTEKAGEIAEKNTNEKN